MNAIKQLIRFVARIAVSRAGLTILNLSIIGIIGRFLFSLFSEFLSSGQFERSVFELFGEGVAIRLVAVGVLLMDRHEILVFAGYRKEDEGPDDFSRATRPYGAVYLSFGLVLEVLLEQTRIPFFTTTGSSVSIVLAVLAIFITIVSVLTCLSLLYDVWRASTMAASHSGPAE